MTDITNELQKRSNGQCELCGSTDELIDYEVKPKQDKGADGYAHLCETCISQIEHVTNIDTEHWQCLRDSMWNTTPAIQVLVHRLLNELKNEAWSLNLLNMLYLDDEVLNWAQAENTAQTETQHKDCNGVVLLSGDTVTLTKDLNVKGASFTAKRGTAVRNISLVHDNPEQIEGRVNGQQLVILTQFVKKS